MDSNKLKSFEHLELVYKQVNGHDIKTSVLMPKNGITGSLPVLVHFHGGGLVMGDKLFLPWWANWLIQLAEKHNAIIISPNYRLIPESTVSDTLQDLVSFWAWIHESLAFEVKKMNPNISPNTERITVIGESAVHGKFPDFLGLDKRVYLSKAMQQEMGLPPIWLIQGREDTAMPLDCAQQFVQDMKALHPETPFHYSLESGGHGFDLKSTLDDDWVKKGVDFIERFWP
ncbi:alpha/beta-hydrolase [Penicillium robsamsonii]|uniref:alpha/beta-hydrolase n=1 Tax=Penicillium robsamsonii TaxID=1792511 RepID=UPI0025494473|nr:alpha/beta-hydrolase [Penicillium robsamsonii]KAJ5813159.1 alpha/beta-hydrolase [Penicillium robsamsonii]